MRWRFIRQFLEQAAARGVYVSHAPGRVPRRLQRQPAWRTVHAGLSRIGEWALRTDGTVPTAGDGGVTGARPASSRRSIPGVVSSLARGKFTVAHTARRQRQEAL